MSKRRDAQKDARKVAKRVARAHDALEARLADQRRIEEEQTRVLQRARMAESGAEEGATRGKKRKKTRALLIINTKSGPNNDSILRVREIVERLKAHGIKPTVRVKLRKKQARKDARKAAKGGYPLVIAAGGDGTIAPVAEGLLGTDAVLGVIPLGTYNNVATCLGVPTDLEAAIALIASGLVRAVDVGMAVATAAKRPRIFLEMAVAGVTAALMPAGQDVKDGKWQEATEILPAALQMSATDVELRLDGEKQGRAAHTLLVEVANGPRSGPGLITAPAARMDDGLLDVAVYHDHTQAALAARFVALKTGLVTEDPQIEHVTCRRLEILSANALPVVADSKVIGRTPARFEILAGSLLVATGRGIALERKPDEAVLAAGLQPAPVHAEEPDEVEQDAVALAAPPAPQRAAGALKAASTAASGFAADVLERARDLLPGGHDSTKAAEQAPDTVTRTPKDAPSEDPGVARTGV